MGKLPKLNNTNQLLTTYQVQFGGLNHTKGASDGEIYDMENMTSDHYPVLCQREQRGLITVLADGANGVFAYDGVVVFVSGSHLRMIKDGQIIIVGPVENSEKVFAPFQNKIIIFPDKVALNLDSEELENLGVTMELTSAVFKAEGMLYGAPAENNTIYSPGAHFESFFNVGDAVEIDGCSIEANNKTPIVREVATDYLRFYENVFKTKTEAYTYEVKKKLPAEATGQYSVTPCYGFVSKGNRVAFHLSQDAEVGTLIEWRPGESSVLIYFADESGTPTETATSAPLSDDDITQSLAFVGRVGDVTETNITLSRTLPDMDFLLTDNNRLWGAKGKTIYASKLGDPTNFNVFDGLSTDSYSVEIGDAGDITAAVNYGGYPTFFKEDGIYRLYGDQPGNFQIMSTMKQGVKKGCSRSLAVAGEVLYYISHNGIMAYNGGVPEKIDIPLGIQIVDGVAGSDGRKYYISVRDVGATPDLYCLYVYDTKYGLWHKEDNLMATYFSYDGRLLCLANGGALMDMTGSTGDKMENRMGWNVVFADMVFGSPFQKGVVKANLRFDLAEGATAYVAVQYDNNDEWEFVGNFVGTGKGTHIFPVVPRRCDRFRIRIGGSGRCDIYAMALQYYNGSEISLRR